MQQSNNRCYKFFHTLAAVVLFSFSATAFASPIGPGYDQFYTPEYTVDLGPINTVMGVVNLGPLTLVGNPIGFGDTDTIVERTDGTGPFEQGDTATVDIELVALSLKSVDPIDLGPTLGSQNFFIILNRGMTAELAQTAPYTPLSVGQMTINHENANGGTFDSFFEVFAELYLGDPLQGQMIGIHQIRLDGHGQWEHTGCWGDPSLDSGGFCVKEIEHTGPHPVVPSIPEPATLTLFGAGFALLGLRRRKQLAA